MERAWRAGAMAWLAERFSLPDRRELPLFYCCRS